MKKIISWNMERRDKSYWASISLLLMVIMNVVPWIESIKIVFPAWGRRDIGKMMIAHGVFQIMVILLIAGFNYFSSKKSSIRVRNKQLLFTFLLKSEFCADLVIGCILEICAIAGMVLLQYRFPKNSIGIWIYLILFLVGSRLYWRNTFPIMQYCKIKSLLEDNTNYENVVWYCISNSKDRVSTFDRVPRKGKIIQPIVDYQDIMFINAYTGIGLKEQAFWYYIIVIEQREELNEVFKKKVESIISIAHAKVLVLYLQKEDKKNDNTVWLENLEHNINVWVKKIYTHEGVEDIDIEQIILDAEIKKQKDIHMPLRFIENNELIKVYLDISNGTKMNLEFLKTIFNRLEILPAIYALFDFIDLQYRVSIAYVKEPSYNWMWKKRMVVGRVMDMANIVEESVIRKNFEAGKILLSTEEVFGQIISEDEWMLIKKYLPNYQVKEDLCVYHTIIYLTTSLRNVLRGHGTFDIEDANRLFELVFKLALMNLYILKIENMEIEVSDTKVWEEFCYLEVISKKDGKEISLSPFLVGLPNENIIVFNNCYMITDQEKNRIVEYINYLDGTLILPEFLNVNIGKDKKRK